MKKRIITLFTLMLIITSGANFVSAEATTGEEITNTTNPQQTETINENQANQKSENESSEDETKSRVGEKVKSNEKGHYNITFDDGYNGYCINYGKNEAKKNDEFTVQETTAAINNKNGESIGHYLKTFFVEFHDIAVKDKYNTQEIIWGFSDNRNTQNPLIRQIKEASLNLIIPDHGAVKKINDTTEAIFNFEV
ncbi:hypothetical protein, partial [Methanobrevibacter sp.]|uniref:hypothetical protein n=1 Tax=Methanobrevibacter sp. TaxID=66852 RepID=UPI0026DF4B49